MSLNYVTGYSGDTISTMRSKSLSAIRTLPEWYKMQKKRKSAYEARIKKECKLYYSHYRKVL